jgi:mannose-6-phosphate isomerase-like protein (cupin superfamily)
MTIVQLSDLIRPGQRNRTVKFEGADFDAGASFFAVDSDPGQRVGLHWHPYSETWIVIEGTVHFRLGDGYGDTPDTAIEEHDAGPGTVVTVVPERHHGFENRGPGVLKMVCIHAAPRMVQYDLEE